MAATAPCYSLEEAGATCREVDEFMKGARSVHGMTGVVHRDPV